MTESQCGTSSFRSMVLRLASNLDAELQAHGGAVRAELRLTPTWFVDARYEKVRVDGRVISQGILIISAVRDSGFSEIFGA